MRAVYDILEYLAGGMMEEEILEDSSERTSEDIKTCVAFAAKPEKKLRGTLLETLKQMKENLIRALKIERILRENKNIVDLNSEIFESSFTAAQVERNHKRGNEYSQLINETLKIGVNVRSEMKKMKESSK